MTFLNFEILAMVMHCIGPGFPASHYFEKSLSKSVSCMHFSCTKVQ
jgi:hypothetical protein